MHIQLIIFYLVCEIMYQYAACNLMIKSEISLPELGAYSHIDQGIKDQVNIMLGHVPDEIPDVVLQGLYYQIKPNVLRLEIPNIAKFMIKNGEQIIIEPVGNIDIENIRTFVLGPCIAILLMQRDLFLMRGLVIKVKNFSISLIGDIETSPLSITASFVKRGYAVLSDEICIINQKLEALPSYPYHFIWLYSKWKQAIYGRHYIRARQNIPKYIVPLRKNFYPEPLPLKKIFILNTSSNNITNELGFLSGGKKIYALQKNIYNNDYVKGLGKSPLYFNYLYNISSKIDFISLHKTIPHEQAIKKIIDLIEAQISDEENA